MNDTTMTADTFNAFQFLGILVVLLSMSLSPYILYIIKVIFG